MFFRVFWRLDTSNKQVLSIFYSYERLLICFKPIVEYYYKKKRSEYYM